MSTPGFVRYVTGYSNERGSNSIPEDAWLRDKDKVLVNDGCPGCSLCRVKSAHDPESRGGAKTSASSVPVFPEGGER